MPTERFDDLIPNLLEAGGLLDKAEAVLKRQLARDPANLNAVWMLGQTYRKKGDLAAAVDTYRRVLVQTPEHASAGYLVAMLSGQTAPDLLPASGRQPVPFVRIEQFLPQLLHDRILAFTLAQQETLKPAGVSNGYKPQTRLAWMIGKRKLGDLAPEFLACLNAVLPTVWARLSLAEQPILRTELQLTAHLSGGFYRPHRDSGEEPNQDRTISYVYYFHAQPKRFSGGDLLLYDTNVTTDTYEDDFTRLTPLDNSLVLFPSHCHHQISPVVCDTADFGHGRFTLNGWLHTERITGDGSAQAHG